MIEAMRSDFFRWAASVDLTVTSHVEVIADVTEAAVANVIAAAIFEAQAHALRRGRAMNNKQCNGTHTLLAGTET